MTRTDATERELQRFLEAVRARNPHEPEFHRAVEELARDALPLQLEHRPYRDARVLERLVEPDRIVTFRVTWEDDDGRIQVDRGWRVQHSNALGPYKGGLRFDPALELSTLKFLAFEQTLKNSLTGLPMGGAKGGASFAPGRRSEREVMRFCHSLMRELHHHIGDETDVPAGDIGVGSREIGFLFGQYVKLTGAWNGALTGKAPAHGGSLVRREATGYGCVQFCRLMLERHGEGLEDRRIAISGAGNVALHAAEKAQALGARVVTLSDSEGTIVHRDGFTPEQLAFTREVKAERGGRVREVAERFDDVEHRAGERPWRVPCDVAMPCAVQNELGEEDAGALVDHGVRAVCEGANMPTTAEARAHLRAHGVLFAPGKAANAGGVAVSGLERSQNALHLSWSRERVEEHLEQIMAAIHERCCEAGGERDGRVDYARGANLAGFRRVADALVAHGAI